MERLDSKEIYVNNAYAVHWSGSGITNKEMHAKGAIKVCFGPIRSGYGDWGGGFSHARSYACQIWIDKDMNILQVKFDDFYNSDESKRTRKTAEKFFKGRKFKKIWTNPMSNLNINLKIAFDEYAGQETHIVGDEFKYEIFSTKKEAANHFLEGLGGMKANMGE